MRVSAKADYAVRALVEMASVKASESQPAKGEALAAAQQIPMRFLENILGELRAHGLVQSRRGSDGGYWLLRAPDQVTIAEIVRAVENPLATIRGETADALEYTGAAAPLRDVWLALRTNIREVLESVTLAEVVAGKLPESVAGLANRPGASTATGEHSTADAAAARN